MEKYAIGLDLGTSSAKAVLFSTEKGVVAKDSADFVYAPAYLPDGSEYLGIDMEKFYCTICGVLKKLGAQLPEGACFGGIAMASASGNSVICDEEGNAIIDGYSWLNRAMTEEIADNVGDNVGDIAGMGSDLIESYVGAIISCITMVLFTGLSTKHILLPILICGVGILASIISVLIVRGRNWKDPHKALNISTYIATAIVVVAVALLSVFYLGEYKYMFCVISGLIAGIGVGFVAELYTSDEFASVQTIAKESQTGHGTNIIAGLGYRSSLFC